MPKLTTTLPFRLFSGNEAPDVQVLPLEAAT